MANGRNAAADLPAIELGHSINGSFSADETVRRMMFEAQSSVIPEPLSLPVKLSVGQRQLWLHMLQIDDGTSYNIGVALDRIGSFSPALMQAALRVLLDRHETLCMTVSADGQAEYRSGVWLRVPFEDLTVFPPEQREARALRWAAHDMEQPFDLAAAPLLRARIVRLGPARHRVYLTMHHIIVDGTSIFSILLPDLTEIYTALENRREPPAQPRNSNFRSYVAWRELQANSPAAHAQMGYWREQLSGELPLLQLPVDHPGASEHQVQALMESFAIAPPLVDQLRRVSWACGATLYMTLLAAFKMLLFRYSGQGDLIVGGVADGRKRPEFEKAAGYALETFAIRTRPAKELSFRQYLVEVREAVLATLDASDITFDRIVNEIHPRRDASHHPVFQAFFSMRPPAAELSSCWEVKQVDLAGGRSRFALALEVGEARGTLEGRFSCGGGAWKPLSLERIAAQWQALLQSIVSNPEAPLDALSMLTEEDQAGIARMNATARDFPRMPLARLLGEQVRRTPRKTAVAFKGENWSFQQLDDRAEAIAACLRRNGVVPGSLVAVLLDRSTVMLAGLVAILKTGAAYLPLHPEMQPAAIAQTLADAQPSAVLTQHSMADRLGSSTLPVVLVEQAARLSDTEDRNRGDWGSPEDRAYVIYTSGTTGKPKGVEVLQSALVNLLTAMQATLGFKAEDVFLALTPISFDIAALELFLPLLCGGTVAIASRNAAHDPELLAQAIRASGATVIQATPATWRMLLDSGWTGRPQPAGRRLKLLCGGEVLPRELADRLLETGAEVWNLYGPTEATVWSTAHRVARGTGPVPIGAPIANTQVYILDSHRRLAPAGIAGELFLGGAGLAKGYLRRPSETAKRFTSVEAIGAGRLYSTGDLALWRPGGEIEVLGRNDNQVKIRGHRVELEAVEAAALRHAGVASAAACAWPDPAGGSRLALYVVAAHAELLDTQELRRFLSATEPDFMVPSDIVTLPRLPLTSHGKLDRARLPVPVTPSVTPPPAAIPFSPDELRLSNLWKQLLAVDQIGLDDDFFDLGGHSLLVAALQQRIFKTFHRRVSAEDLFHKPTIRLQAELVKATEQMQVALPAGVFELQSAAGRQNIFWINYHQFNRNLAHAIGGGYRFLSVGLASEDAAYLTDSAGLKAIAGVLKQKILAVQPNGPYVVGGLCAGGALAYEIASQLKEDGLQVSLVVLLDATNPSRVKLRSSFNRRFKQLQYRVRLVRRVALRVTLIEIKRRLLRPFRLKSNMADGQQRIEAAATQYRPNPYDGKVLLLQALDCPPYVDLRSEWQVLTPDLEFCYVDGHHSELLNAQNVHSVAGAIRNCLAASVKTQELMKA